MKLQLLLLMIGVAAMAAPQAKNLGVLSTQGEVGCLVAFDGALKPGTLVTVLHNFMSDAPKPVGLKVGRKLNGDCTKRRNAMGEGETVFYEVLLPKGVAATNGANGVVYLGSSIQTAAPGWMLDGKPVSVKDCVAGEGVHLTAWSGKPLVSNRIWHFYYYLGVSMEPNCTEKEAIP